MELQGRILDERERQALRVVVENIPGVKAVKDHLVWVEPMSSMTFGPPERHRRAGLKSNRVVTHGWQEQSSSSSHGATFRGERRLLPGDIVRLGGHGPRYHL